jgi:hypothetical protein
MIKELENRFPETQFILDEGGLAAMRGDDHAEIPDPNFYGDLDALAREIRRQFDSQTLEEYVRNKYPSPKPNDSDWEFYSQWGYNEWLKRRFKKNLEQLCILHRHEHNMTQAGQFLEGKGAESLKGCPIVRAREIVSRFLMGRAHQGSAGVALWETAEGEVFCWFPSAVSALSRVGVMGLFDSDEVEFVGEHFKDIQHLESFHSPVGIAHRFETHEKFVTFPDDETVYYVFKTHGDYCQRYTFWVAPAEEGTTVKYRVPQTPKGDWERKYLKLKDFPQIEVVAHKGERKD